MKIAIISHTEHYKNKEDVIVGWGPTIKELNYLLESVDSIVHIAPLHHMKPPDSALSYNSEKINFVALKPSGGKGIYKLTIFLTLFHNLFKIYKATRSVDFIQFRAPTGMGIYVLPYLKFFKTTKYWVKYAGNWKDQNIPFGNRIQKKWLQKFTSLDTKITVNGNWNNERSNIISFENPCLDEIDRENGNKIIANKIFNKKINFCFVGALNEHKGVDIIIDTFNIMNSDKIGEIHFVGDGIDKKKYINLSKEIKYETKFHGFLAKDAIINIYKDAHFIILPSKSEGFPKVIGEAMNFGCIPIVSNVSCIGEYIENNKNGFLIEKPFESNLKEQINKALHLKNVEFQRWILYNYNLAEKFTYSYYNSRIKNEIFNKKEL